jgi:hypothetical protein
MNRDDGEIARSFARRGGCVVPNTANLRQLDQQGGLPSDGVSLTLTSSLAHVLLEALGRLGLSSTQLGLRLEPSASASDAHCFFYAPKQELASASNRLTRAPMLGCGRARLNREPPASGSMRSGELSHCLLD